MPVPSVKAYLIIKKILKVSSNFPRLSEFFLKGELTAAFFPNCRLDKEADIRYNGVTKNIQGSKWIFERF